MIMKEKIMERMLAIVNDYVDNITCYNDFQTACNFINDKYATWLRMLSDMYYEGLIDEYEKKELHSYVTNILDNAIDVLNNYIHDFNSSTTQIHSR